MKIINLLMDSLDKNQGVVHSGGKRIVKNTLYLYIRMLVMMGVTLFTSRVVLDVLGSTDYGINNVINGVVVLFSFLNTALLTATQRFLNYYIGQDNTKQVRVVFCMSMNTYIILSIFVLILGETVGLWFVNTMLNIPPNRMFAAQWVYQFTIIQFVINLIRIPYNATIIAYEHMNFYAYISLAEVIFKLLLIYILYVTSFDKLIVYSFLYTIIPFFITYFYKVYCNKNFETSKYSFIWEKKTFVEIFSFSSWSLFGSLANLSAQQGLNILINIFYGVTVNAAVGISNQVSNAVNSFVSNFQVAYRPQIVKAYASNRIDEYNDLIFRTSKFSYYLMIIVTIPIMFTLDGILEVWLTEVPLYTNIFCRLILVFLCIDAFSMPLVFAVQATGNIKTYQILMAIIIFFNLPLAYVTLKLGWPVYSVWYIRIVINVVIFVVRCIYMRYKYLFPILSFFRESVLPAFLVTILSLPIPSLMYYYSDSFLFKYIVTAIVSVLFTGFVILFVGINKAERSFFVNIVLSKIKRK